MVRLVFRPYTQLRRSICTSESLRTSTRVSSGFILARHSSPSFGSQHVCSWYSPPAMGHASPEPAPRGDRPSARKKRAFTLIAPLGLVRPMTRTHVGLLGPCFKTGRVDHRSTTPQNGQATAPARGRSEERAPEWDRRRASQDTGGSPSAGGRFRPPRPSTAPQRVAATYWGGSTPVGARETRTGPCGPRLPACRRPPG